MKSIFAGFYRTITRSPRNFREHSAAVATGPWNLSLGAMKKNKVGLGKYPDPNNEYDAVWHGKLAFQDVGNGDFLAIEVGADAPDSVVYLNHDDGEGHGRRLGADFEDFLLRWSKLGCVGAEDWQWMPFAPTGGYLDPDCDLARLFRNQLSLNI